MATILLVEDDVSFCTMLQTFLEKKQYGVKTAFSAGEAYALLEKQDFDLVISDVRLPDGEGLDILQEVKKKDPARQVIMMTGYAEIKMAVKAMKAGAFDYIEKPFRPEVILQTVEKALEVDVSEVRPGPGQEKDTKPASKAKQAAEGEPRASYVKGVSDTSKKLNDYIQLVAPTSMSVLIMGESGTGKEQVAKSIHDKSKRKDAPFIAVDCGAIPKELASSEFFGHLKGSFTGAVSNKTGAFEAANGGTIFLDEIGNLSYELQVQLLRALQERRVKPVGSNEEIVVDIRVIAATNEDLNELVQEGEFREDLFHRLNEFSIQVPALRDREEDLVIFSNYFLDLANQELDKQVRGFSEEVIKVFKRYEWPGNLRELKNTVKRAVLLSQGEVLQVDVLPHEMIVAKPKEESYGLFKNRNEQQMILDALEKTQGNKSKAAKLLSIDRKTLYNKLKQYDIRL